MAAIACSADGACVFMALQSGGFPVVVQAARSGLTTQAAVYQPGAGSAGNVSPCLANPDKMFFYGNFGTDVGLIEHTISTGANTDISPSSLGAKVINTLWANPGNEDEIIVTVDTDQDLIYTDDGGTTWYNWDTALGFNATASWVLWSSVYFPHRYFVGGDAGATLDILYSPNEGANSSNTESAAEDALAAVSGIEATEV